jgi:hypothetical protein
VFQIWGQIWHRFGVRFGVRVKGQSKLLCPFTLTPAVTLTPAIPNWGILSNYGEQFIGNHFLAPAQEPLRGRLAGGR